MHLFKYRRGSVCLLEREKTHNSLVQNWFARMCGMDGCPVSKPLADWRDETARKECSQISEGRCYWLHRNTYLPLKPNPQPLSSTSPAARQGLASLGMRLVVVVVLVSIYLPFLHSHSPSFLLIPQLYLLTYCPLSSPSSTFGCLCPIPSIDHNH